MATYTPEQKAEAVNLRALGFSLAAIGDRLGVPIRTLSDWFRATGTKKGNLTAEALAEQRRELVRAVLGAEAIQAAIAAGVADDLALSRAVRDRIAQTLDYIKVTDLGGAVLAARALAALATAVKATGDLRRIVLEPHNEPVEGDLPTLPIGLMSDEEIAALRARQVKEAGSFDIADAEPEVDSP